MKVKTASSSSASYLVVGLLAYVVSLLLPKAISDCPLDLGRANFTLAASFCSNNDERAKCCRYINACLAVSVSRYANATGDLGVTSDLTEICLSTISKTLELHGVPRNVMVSCGFGTKIPVNYECQGRITVTQMLRSAGFEDVTRNCMVPLSVESNCRKCVNAGIVYLHHLAGTEDGITFSTCRDATYAAIASQVDNITSLSIAACFFGIQELSVGAVSNASQSSPTPEASQSPVVADSPSQLVLGIPLKESHHSYHLTLVPGIGIIVTVGAVLMLVVLVFLIHRKGKELEDSNNMDVASSKKFPPQSIKKLQEGQSLMFRKFSYKDTKKATDNFKTVIGQGGFGTVYKAQFSDGSVLAVKHMDKVSKQGEDDFCREIELLARLHHRHLVALRGFCIKKHKRFLMYEYMANGNLKDHLHASQRPLSWQRRIQIAIDVANALEYLHFYCDPPLCHRDIKSSNILLDENFVAKVADFGLAHASKDGSICFEPVNTDIRGTPGYMDPQYVVTHELTEKSDVYSYGVLLLELVTARRAIQDSKNLVEWAQPFLSSYSQVSELVDASIRGSFDLEQLHTVITIVQWCTQREGQARPSIKQVLRLLYESSDPVHSGFIHSADEDFEGSEGSRGRPSKGKMHKTDDVFHSGEGRFLASSSSTSRSYCSRSFLLDNSSPHSPPNIPSL